MLQGLIGKKTFQSQGFLQDGTRVPLSSVFVLDNTISQVKTADKDGYNSIQIGFDIKKKPNKALEGHGKKAGLEKTPRFLKEIRVDDSAGFELGAKIDTNEIFKPGDIVDVTGVSKGKGFAGGVKRWGFHGGPRTHGQSDRERAPGSIGQTTTPGRVYKGKKMAGKMGNTTATVKNLEIVEITADGVILIKGLIPGPLDSLVMVKKTGENKKFVPLYKEEKEEPKEEVAQETVSEEAQDVSGTDQTHSSDDAQKSSDETLRSPQQLEESSNASTPAVSQDETSGHGQATPDSSEDSSRAEAPRVSEAEQSAVTKEEQKEEKGKDK